MNEWIEELAEKELPKKNGFKNSKNLCFPLRKWYTKIQEIPANFA